MSSATIVRDYEIPSPDVAVGAETALAETCRAAVVVRHVGTG